MAEKEKMKCKHCEFINKLSEDISDREDKTNREYWLITEVFVYLHNGKDYCDFKENIKNEITVVHESK